jgi:hypothetical protein
MTALDTVSPVLRSRGSAVAPKTMFEKIWDAHVVYEEPGKPTLIYVDLHLIN